MNKYRKPFLYLRNLAVCEELPDLLGHLGPHPSDVRHLFEGGDGLRIGADGGDGCDKNTRFYKGAFYHLTISVAKPVFFRLAPANLFSLSDPAPASAQITKKLGSRQAFKFQHNFFNFYHTPSSPLERMH